MRPRALACPASLKGVLDAPEAAAALAEGFRGAGIAAEEVPVADGGEGTVAVLASALGGSWFESRVTGPLGEPVDARFLVTPNGIAVIEAAAALGLGLVDRDARDPLRATSRGLGELIAAALEHEPRDLLVGLGGTATVDGGAGLREVLDELPVRTRILCDVGNPLLGPRGAARLFGPQKGASSEVVEELERRLAGMAQLAPLASLPGAGAAGGLGAALAALGAELVPGGSFVIEAIGLRDRLAHAALVVTGEGTVDRTTLEGKAPAAVLELCRRGRVPCAVFGGRVEERLADVPLYPLSGVPERARADLRALGERLGGVLLAGGELAGERLE